MLSQIKEQEESKSQKQIGIRREIIYFEFIILKWVMNIILIILTLIAVLSIEGAIIFRL